MNIKKGSHNTISTALHSNVLFFKCQYFIIGIITMFSKQSILTILFLKLVYVLKAFTKKHFLYTKIYRIKNCISPFVTSLKFTFGK